MFEKIRQRYNKFGISAKITVTYTICFIILLMLTNLVMSFGVFFALYRPAEKTIQYSMQQVQKLLEQLEQNENVNPHIIREPLVPGVVLRVADSNDNVFIDTDPRYPSLEKFNGAKMNNPPIFADKSMDVADIGSALIYRAKLDYVHEGEHFILYFFRTITSEKKFFDDLQNFLIFLDIVGVLLAVFVGNFISKKTLKPIKTMTNLAKEIAFKNMDGRIPISPAEDELTELAKTLNKMLDRLQGGISKQQKFVSDASHELRTPATIIKGYIEILEKYGMTDRELLDESVEAIRSEAKNMQSLLENLLFLARTDQNRQKLNKENFELSEMISDVMNKMKTVITSHNVRLLENDSAEIFGDKTTILQMIRIFLDNATKYTPTGGTIEVSSVREGENIFVKISDSGVGIAPENQEKVFERFFRIDCEDSVKGTGLGLSIAKWIADQHGIKIKLESELGKGTTFTLKIPCV